MSTATQLAREEAERVEAEERAALEAAAAEGADQPGTEFENGVGDNGAQTPPQSAGETPEPARQPSDGPSEADLKALEKEHRRHESAMRKLMGDDFDAFQPCEGCGGAGFVPLGTVALPVTQADPACEVCNGCLGLGFRSTGSFMPGQETISCSDCVGKGYRAKLEPVPTPTAIPGAPPQTVVSIPGVGDFQVPPGHILVPTGQ